MSLVVVSPPTGLVDIDLAKRHLRETTTNEDQLIQAYIDAASAWIDGPSGWLGRSIGKQTLELRTSTFSGAARLPCGPVTKIVSVDFVGPTGLLTTLAESSYVLGADGLALPGGSFRWPALRGDPAGVVVRYEAGSDIVPAPIQQAVLLLVGQWFRNRMAVTAGGASGGQTELPNGVRALLGPYRNMRF